MGRRKRRGKNITTGAQTKNCDRRGHGIFGKALDLLPKSNGPRDTAPMALKATIYKATLQLADMDRNHYSDHELTIARHPSETDERMLDRLLAFALNVPDDEDHGSLDFAKDMW